MILAIFDLQVAHTLPPKFQVSWHFGSEEIFKMAAMEAIWDFR